MTVRRLGALVSIGALLLAACASITDSRQDASQATSVTAARHLADIRVGKAYASLPLSFEANEGQTTSGIDFVARGQGYGVFLRPTRATLKLESSKAETQETVSLELIGASGEARMSGRKKLSGVANYFIGDDPKKWHTNIPTFEKVVSKDVYDRIDLVYYGAQGGLEHDFVVAPGADVKDIAFSLEGVDDLSFSPEGDLELDLGADLLTLTRPVAYQRAGGVREAVPARFVLHRNGNVGFWVSAHDATKPLVIDPVLAYSTYLGGSDADIGAGVAVDAAGSAHVTGSTDSIDFPTANSLGGNDIFTDVFVAKLSTDGSTLIYSTYLGGERFDDGVGVAVDATGSAYVTGQTESPDFPVAGALQADLAGEDDVFVAKLTPDGSALSYSTYLGGSEFESPGGVTVDAAGSAYVSGRTLSVDFPTAAPVQEDLAGGFDAFMAKFSPDGSALAYSTYLGGSSDDLGDDVAVDAMGSAYLTGTTSSFDFPTAGPLQPDIGGFVDAFVAKLAPDGSALTYSSYLGGSNDEAGGGVAVDAAGSAYVTGSTFSADFPTVAPLQPGRAGGLDDFVARFAPDGSTLIYSTYLGGSRDDFGNDVAVDAAGSAHVTGITYSLDFPTVAPVQPRLAGDSEAFVARLGPDGSALDYSTYLGGGGGDDFGIGVAVDATRSAYAIGSTTSADFPATADAFDTSFNGCGEFGCQDAFVAKIASDEPGPRCAGAEATIVGTSGPDVLQGTPARDVIAGLGGNDVILGVRSNDRACGGTGNDRLVGLRGNDRLSGGAGNDRLIGRRGDDSLRGNDGNDFLDGRSGDDHVNGGSGDDTLNGGSGDDSLDSRDSVEHNDSNHGGKGVDVCRADPRDIVNRCEQER